jgi:hypothetical protein
MPKNKVSDPITDQGMSFARLVLSGAMTDRHAAEAAGLNPDSAAYIKSKPHVRAYMLEHRAAVQQQLVKQEAEGLHRLNLDREQVLGRLWEIAKLSPEMTRNSITGQVKAISMIIAMQNFIPDRKAVSQKKSNTAPAPQIDASAWLTKQHGQPQPLPVPVQEEAAPDLSSRPERTRISCYAAPDKAACGPFRKEGPMKFDNATEVPQEIRGSAVEGPAVPTPAFAIRLSPSESQPAPYVPVGAFVPDPKLPFSIDRSPFKHLLQSPLSSQSQKGSKNIKFYK